MSQQNNVDDFFQRVAEAQQSIEALAEPFFRRVLLLSLLDALSRAAFPAMRRNRRRFVGFIDTYSQWPDSKRYSLQQLYHCLKRVKAPAEYPTLPNLFREVERRIHLWPVEPRILFPQEVDPTVQELQNLIDSAIAEVVEQARYPSLVWTLRNFAVHELRNPGGGMDFEIGQPTPYYHRLTWAITQKRTWELYFPVEFISNLVSDCAHHLKNHFLQEAINPWDAFSSGSDWYNGP